MLIRRGEGDIQSDKITDEMSVEEEKSAPVDQKFLNDVSDIYKKREEEIKLQWKLKREKKEICEQLKPIDDQMKSSKKRVADLDTSLLHQMTANRRRLLPMPGFNTSIEVERREYKERLSEKAWIKYIDLYFKENGLMHLQQRFMEEFDPEGIANVEELWEFIDKMAREIGVGYHIKKHADMKRVSTKDVVSIKKLKTGDE